MSASVQRELIMEEARQYYLDRKEYLPTTGTEKEKKLVRDRQERRAYGYGKEINMKAISPIKTICNNFWLLIQKLIKNMKKKLEEIEPEDDMNTLCGLMKTFGTKVGIVIQVKG